MAEKKLSSRDLMSLLDNTYSRITDMETNISNLKLNLDSRLSVIRNMQEYENKKMTELTNLVDKGKWVNQATKIVLANSNKVGGVYEIFGSSVHPKFLKDPTDILNYKTVNGYAFKDNAAILINGISKPRYLAALQHDSILDQDICFEEFDTPNLEIEIKINPGKLLGSTNFNLIELVPFMPGSFDISNIEVYSLQGYYMNDTVPDSSISNTIHNVGVSRILLDRTVTMYKVKFNVKINHKNQNGAYPFGIKHIYFLNAEFNPDSYIVIKSDQVGYIDTISENLTVVDQTGQVNTTCKEEGLELYIEWDNGIGIDQIATSKGINNNPIPRDIKSFYIKYPIKRSTNSIQFNNIELR